VVSGKTVFAEISEIPAEKKNPVCDPADLDDE
jgi:hypothetical protein